MSILLEYFIPEHNIKSASSDCHLFNVIFYNDQVMQPYSKKIIFQIFFRFSFLLHNL